jgi:hypothetical protein
MTQYESDRGSELSGWAAGGITFAAVLMVMIGTFEAIAGLTAVIDDEFFVVTPKYTFEFDTTTWGWIHLILGSTVALSGLYLFAGRAWAGVVALVLAVLVAIANFFFIPYYPFWSITVIALACWVIWSLTRPGALRA